MADKSSTYLVTHRTERPDSKELVEVIHEGVLADLRAGGCVVGDRVTVTDTEIATPVEVPDDALHVSSDGDDVVVSGRWLDRVMAQLQAGRLGERP